MLWRDGFENRRMRAWHVALPAPAIVALLYTRRGACFMEGVLFTLVLRGPGLDSTQDATHETLLGVSRLMRLLLVEHITAVGSSIRLCCSTALAVQCGESCCLCRATVHCQMCADGVAR
jgi:hypothetical protein